jgi:Rrf2 family protein
LIVFINNQFVRLSKKGEYAVRALISIAQAQASPHGALLQIATIAESSRIPEKFLEQILLVLKNAAILKSKRGVDGGYALNRLPEQITVGEVIRLMDGPLAPIPCVSKTAYEPCNCPDEATCGLRMAMQKVRDALSDLLDNYTLQQVLDEVSNSRSGAARTLQFDI